MSLFFLSSRGNELLERARSGRACGIVDAHLLYDIETVLLDGDESANDRIDEELRKVGA